MAEMDEQICNIWLWILSCLLINVELLYRRFHWCYVCLCVIGVITSCGNLGPVLSHISFAVYAGLVLWTYYWHHHSASQARADNAVPLYVGERISSDNAEDDITMEKWIVAMKTPADNIFNRYDYLLVKAITGTITHKQQKRKRDISNFYRLNQVGWSNLDKMQKGNRHYDIFGDLCNESAINTALQITNSTFYTYFKCMMLYRPDTLFVYLFLLCSLFVHQCCSLPIGADLYSSVTLITAVVNFIVVIEISMLQPGKRFAITETVSYYRSAIKQDFVKFLNFCKNILCAIAKSILHCLCATKRKFQNFCKNIMSSLSDAYSSIGVTVLYYLSTENTNHQVNLTKKPGAAGPEVVDTVVSQIENAKIFDDDHMHDYVRRIARVESKDGLDSMTYRDGYHGGLWQVDKRIFLVTQNIITHSILIDKHKLIKKQFGIDWLSIQWKDLRIPLWSGLAACLYIYTVEVEIPSSIDKQAYRWYRNYNSKKIYPRKPEEFVVKVKEFETSGITVCYRDIDLFIVLDSSGSITKQKYEIAKKFVVDLISGFTVGKKNVRVGLVIYGSTVHLQFDLNNSFNQTVVVDKIRNIPYLESRTATGDAIMHMVESFTEEKGARPPDLAVPRVGIVLTDGQSNAGSVNVFTAAQIARNKSIEMFAFGIGYEINDKELLEIAGSQERKFKIDSFDNIDDARALIIRRSCKVGIKAGVNTTYQDNLDSGKRRLFEYAVPKKGLTIYIQVTKGKITLYGSHSNRDPSPVWHDYMVKGIYGRKEIVIAYPTASNEHDEITKPFYCNLVGTEDSVFSIQGVYGTY